MKTRIHARPVAGLALGCDTERLIQERKRASVRLFLISFLQGIRKLEKSLQTSALADDQVAKMRRQCRNEMEGIESFCQNFVKCDQGSRIVAFQECIDQ